MPLKISHVEELDDDSEDTEYLYMLDGPLPHYKDLDVGGIDSYDQDLSMTSSSLGSMVVYRRANSYSPWSDAPVALIRCRPHRKEVFYELCLKLSVHYDLKRNVLIDVRTPLIIQYFKDFGGYMYLAERPQSFESEFSKQMHDFGVAMTVRSKPQMIALLQTWVVDNIHNCWFQWIVKDLQEYDITAKDSDWDSADALGFALMRIQDMRFPVMPENAKTLADPYSISGNADNMESEDYVERPDRYKTVNGTDIKDPFMRWLIDGE